MYNESRIMKGSKVVESKVEDIQSYVNRFTFSSVVVVFIYSSKANSHSQMNKLIYFRTVLKMPLKMQYVSNQYYSNGNSPHVERWQRLKIEIFESSL